MPGDAMLSLPGIGFRMSNELGDGLGRDRWMHHEISGESTIEPTGAMSRRKSKLSLS